MKDGQAELEGVAIAEDLVEKLGVQTIFLTDKWSYWCFLKTTIAVLI